VLVLRAGFGSADPHSRRGVARILDVRVQRVRRLERRGLREARALSRAGACGGGSSSSSTSSFTGVSGGTSSSPTGTDTGASGAGASEPDTDTKSTDTGSGDVRGESESQAPPSLPDGGGHAAEPGGVSLAIGIGLILAALALGFATPHLRARLRSP
jgi:hypothetical protein